MQNMMQDSAAGNSYAGAIQSCLSGNQIGLWHLGVSQWAHKHFIEAQRISPMRGHNCIWVYNVPSALAHLVRTGIHSDAVISFEHKAVSILLNVSIRHPAARARVTRLHMHLQSVL